MTKKIQESMDIHSQGSGMAVPMSKKAGNMEDLQHQGAGHKFLMLTVMRRTKLLGNMVLLTNPYAVMAPQIGNTTEALATLLLPLRAGLETNMMRMGWGNTDPCPPDIQWTTGKVMKMTEKKGGGLATLGLQTKVTEEGTFTSKEVMCTVTVISKLKLSLLTS